MTDAAEAPPHLQPSSMSNTGVRVATFRWATTSQFTSERTETTHVYADRKPVLSIPSSSIHQNTSLLNNTSTSDWVRNSRSGVDSAEAPPSPAPRIGETHDSFGFQELSVGRPVPHIDPLRRGADWRLGDFRDSDSSAGSRGVPGPSATRPLFTSNSASAPRDKNVIVGDTGPAVISGNTSARRRGDESLLHRSLFNDRPNWEKLAPEDGPSSSFSRPAFSSTYVGTISGARPLQRPSLGGVGVADADWRGTAPYFRRWDTGADSRSVAGLVESRSRARVDKWTDEEAHETADSGVVLRHHRNATHRTSPHRHRSRRHDERGGGGGHRRDRGKHDDDPDSDKGHRTGGEGDDASDSSDEDPSELTLSFANAIVSAMESQPVVPAELLRTAQELPFVWDRHPSHCVVLSLLQHRGIYLPRYRELVEYHMAELFLHYLDLCREGAFFVYYEAGRCPKERFFRIRMLPVDRFDPSSEPVPQLVITLHESGVQILDIIPLDHLVGVTVTPQSACFRPFLESPDTIIGCREGRGHRARLPVDGAFSLWFYDINRSKSLSVDLLTCDAKVFDIWTRTFRGLVSVNSSSVVQVALSGRGESVTLAELTQAAQQQSEIDYGSRRGASNK